MSSRRLPYGGGVNSAMAATILFDGRPTKLGLASSEIASSSLCLLIILIRELCFQESARREPRMDRRSPRLIIDHWFLSKMQLAARSIIPHNLRRIVFLTEIKDSNYIQSFEDMTIAGLLPVYLEIHTEKHLNVELTKR